MSIRVIAYRDGDSWVAQCLEYDISAQGSDFDTAMQRLEIVVNAQCEYTQREYGQAFARIDPAPQAFTARWDRMAGDLC